MVDWAGLSNTRHRAGVAALALLAGLSLSPAHAQEPSGLVSFHDDQASLDQVVVSVAHLPAPADGQVYRVWLRSQDLAKLQPLGELVPREDGMAGLVYSQPAGENLLGIYSQVLVSQEPADPPSAAPGAAVVLRGEVDRGALVQARRLLVRWPEERYGIASLDGLRRMAGLARLHSAILGADAVTGNLPAVRRKAEQVANLAEGRGGLAFGDHNRDGLVEDPGDGVGLLRYAWGAHRQARIAWSQAVDEGVSERALSLEPPLVFAVEQIGLIRDLALELAAVQDESDALALAEALALATERVAAAVDTRGDEELAALLAERGLSPIYSHALDLVQLALRP